MWRVAERFEPGYGAATAVVLGLGTIVLPFSQMLFSHVFTTFLSFAAFWLMLRERDGPPSPMLLGLAGLAMGYAFSSEYPTFFAAIVLGLFLLSRKDSLHPLGVLRRGGAYVAGGLVGIVPLLLYNHYAFRSWTHLAYSDVPRQQKGFFGIGAPSLRVLSTLLLDSRGLLTISPVLIMGAIGTVMLYRRGRRAEALTIGGICLCFLGYNSGYYLPFGGGSVGPRFLDTMLPFLAFPIALTLKRFPGPTIALAAISITTMMIATVTHPLVGYENETVTWMRYLSKGFFQPTIASAYGLGRGWGGIWPFFLVRRRGGAGGGVGDAAPATLARRRSRGACVALVGWALFAALAPTVLGIDHAGLQSIYKAGDHTAFNLTLHSGARYPLKTLALVAAVAGLLALVVAWVCSEWGRYAPGSSAPAASTPTAASPARSRFVIARPPAAESASAAQQRLKPLEHVEVVHGRDPREQRDEGSVRPDEDAIAPALDAGVDRLGGALGRGARERGEFLDERVLVGSAMVVDVEAGVLDDLRRDAAGVHGDRAHAGPAQLVTQRLGVPAHGELRCAVGALRRDSRSARTRSKC